VQRVLKGVRWEGTHDAGITLPRTRPGRYWRALVASTASLSTFQPEIETLKKC
jgi:hypothetical protein